MSKSDMETKAKPNTQRPKKFTALFVNDDFTPVEFVEMVMMKIFNQTAAEANAITMKIHTAGKANVGVYTREVAETKVHHAMDAAKAAELPLTCKVEPA